MSRKRRKLPGKKRLARKRRYFNDRRRRNPFGIPNWLLLAGGALAAWYFFLRKKTMDTSAVQHLPQAPELAKMMTPLMGA